MPPQPATVNAVADALDIPRTEALRLAGILTEHTEPLSPECRYEQEIMTEDISDQEKTAVIAAHRLRGHQPWCQPGAAQPEAVPDSALRA